VARYWLQVGRLLHYQGKSHQTTTIRGKTRCVLLYHDISRHSTCPLNKCIYSLKVVKPFSKHSVYMYVLSIPTTRADCRVLIYLICIIWFILLANMCHQIITLVLFLLIFIVCILLCTEIQPWINKGFLLTLFVVLTEVITHHIILFLLINYIPTGSTFTVALLLLFPHFPKHVKISSGDHKGSGEGNNVSVASFLSTFPLERSRRHYNNFTAVHVM
jgi:hypothetical protein